MTSILLDPQIFNEQNFGGISRSYTEIYIELSKLNDIRIEFPLFYTSNIHLKESAFFEHSYQLRHRFLIRFSKIFRHYLPRKLKRKSLKRACEILKAQSVDIFIPTYYNPYFLEPLQDKPFVLTVYDMIHELFPHYFEFDSTTVPNKKLLIAKATKIIAISQSTKKDILKVYPETDASKIEVVHLAPSIKTAPSVLNNLPEQYILFVGNRDKYKNFLFFLRAVAPILSQAPNLRLMCAGGNPFDNVEHQYLKDLKIEAQVLQQNFEDSELQGYYSNALFFVFPSEYEGFGIPVLEAMACGCPVILANHSSFPEVAGDAGIFFELNDIDGLRRKMQWLLQYPDIRKKYREKGLRQAKKFTWKRTALECLSVYQKALRT